MKRSAYSFYSRSVSICLLAAALVLAAPALIRAQVLFDFDNAPLHSPLPIDLNVGGINAHFSADPAYYNYSIQRADVLGFTPAGFAGYCIYPSTIYRCDLKISFDHPLTVASIMYAPEEYATDSSCTMRITGYLGTTYVATHTYQIPEPGTWPTGVLTLNSTQPFDNVVIHYESPPPTGGDYGPIFMADNLTVTTAAGVTPTPSPTPTPTPVLTCVQPPSGMISWWRGEDNANDVLGTNNGTLIGGVTFANGEVGRAFDFSGNGDYVRVSTPAGLPLGNSARTMLMWFKTPGTWGDTHQVVIQYGGNSAGSKFGIYIPDYWSRTLSFWGENSDFAGSTPLLLNTWYQGAVTYDGSTVKLYLNGQPETSSGRSLNTVLNSGGFTIGRTSDVDNITSEWNGLVDEAMIFDRALSQSEVQAIYDAGYAGVCAIPTPTPTPQVTPTPAFTPTPTPTPTQTPTPMPSPTPSPTVPARALFDFDGDRKTDLSIFRPSVGEWYYENSSSGLTYGCQFGTSTDAVASADFTGDGKTDVAFWRPSTGYWYVLRSEDWTYFAFPFGASGDIPVPADFDGDGRADAAVFRPAMGTWFILRSTGGVSSVQFGLSADMPVVSDYDGDGKADIAIVRPSVGEWWIYKSSNGQVLAAQFGTPTDRYEPGDFTGDGKSDMAFFRPSTGYWYVLRSEDYSYFAFPFGMNGDKPVACDYDGDGKYDAAVFRPAEGNWYISRSTGGVSIRHFGLSGDIPLPYAYAR